MEISSFSHFREVWSIRQMVNSALLSRWFWPSMKIGQKFNFLRILHDSWRLSFSSDSTVANSTELISIYRYQATLGLCTAKAWVKLWFPQNNNTVLVYKMAFTEVAPPHWNPLFSLRRTALTFPTFGLSHENTIGVLPFRPSVLSVVVVSWEAGRWDSSWSQIMS